MCILILYNLLQTLYIFTVLNCTTTNFHILTIQLYYTTIKYTCITLQNDDYFRITIIVSCLSFVVCEYE